MLSLSSQASFCSNSLQLLKSLPLWFSSFFLCKSLAPLSSYSQCSPCSLQKLPLFFLLLPQAPHNALLFPKTPEFAPPTNSAATATFLFQLPLSTTLQPSKSTPQTTQTTSFVQPFSLSNNSQKRFLSDSMMTRVDPRLAFKSIHDGQSESDTWPNVLQ